MDDNGLDDEPVPFEVAIEVEGSTVRVDFSNAPDARQGRSTARSPRTVSAAAIAIINARGRRRVAERGALPADRGRRPARLDVPPRPPVPVLPLRLAGDAGDRGRSTTRRRGDARRRSPPAAAATSARSSGGASARRPASPGRDGSPHPVGQGASVHGDGANSLHPPDRGGHALRAAPRSGRPRTRGCSSASSSRADSGGPGQYRGGLGVDTVFRDPRGPLRDIRPLERTKNAPWGLAGGLPARPNSVALQYPDGRRIEFSKITRLEMPKGSILEIRTGGGGGYGDPSLRLAESVHEDVREGYTTEEHARLHYPHAFR